jgi:hypothetical protein
MFRPNPKKAAEKESLLLGKRLRKLCKTYNDKIALAEAADIIAQHGNDPVLINAQGELLYSPIFWTIWRNHTELTHALMLAPAINLSLKNGRGETLLVFALLQLKPDHELISHLLTQKDIDINCKDKERGVYALLAATTNKKLCRYIPALLERTDSSILYDAGRVSGHYAYYDYGNGTLLVNLVMLISDIANHSHAPMLLSCIDTVINTSCITQKKQKIIARQAALDYSLMVAAQAGNDDVVSILLKGGANKAIKDANGRTAFELAKYNSHPETALILQDPLAIIAEQACETWVANNNNAPKPRAPQPEYNAPPRSNDAAPDASAPPLEDEESKQKPAYRY